MIAMHIMKTNTSLLDDTARMNWLNENGRVAKFSDGWNAWNAIGPNRNAINHDIRKAIDEAMDNRKHET